MALRLGLFGGTFLAGIYFILLVFDVMEVGSILHGPFSFLLAFFLSCFFCSTCLKESREFILILTCLLTVSLVTVSSPWLLFPDKLYPLPTRHTFFALRLRALPFSSDDERE